MFVHTLQKNWFHEDHFEMNYVVKLIQLKKNKLAFYLLKGRNISGETNPTYLYKLVDPVKVVVGPCSLLRDQALLQGGEAAVHVVL